MFAEKWKKEILTLPNLLSAFRLALIPVYMQMYLHAVLPMQYLAAGTVLTVSCITDLLDGMIARQFHLITTLGKILDPLADKATQFALILCLSLRHPPLRYVLILFLTKECFQTFAALFALRRRFMLPGALPEGKLCTAMLFSSLIVLVLFPDIPDSIIRIISLTDILFLLLAFAGYVLAYSGRNTILQKFQNSH